MVKITHKYGLSSLSIFNAITPHIIAYMWDVGSSPDSKVKGPTLGPSGADRTKNGPKMCDKMQYSDLEWQ